jgi:putative phage-type endonuclease
VTAVPQRPFHVLALQQGTDAWRQWRNGVIGASDAPIIMGENPFKSRKVLLNEKRGVTEPLRGNQATAIGNLLEPIALKNYQQQTGLNVVPAVLESRGRPWQIASVDGIDAENHRVLEIKCGEKVYLHTRRYLTPPRYYVGQLQHTLAVTGYAEIDFYCYWPHHEPVLVSVKRDDAYIQRLIQAEIEFLGLMKMRLDSQHG